MAWINVGTIKGDTGDTGASGSSPYINVDRAHGFIVFGSGDREQFFYFSDLKGPKGDTCPVNLVSTLDTIDTTNAVTNSAIATAIEDVVDQIGTITSAQQSNLTLLGS